MRKVGKKWMVWSATNSNPSTSPIDNRNNIEILEYCGLPVDMDSQKLKSIQDKKISNLEKINNNLIHEMNREYVSNTYNLKSKDLPVKIEELEYEVVRGKNNKGELTLYIRYKNNSKYKITNLSLGIDDYNDGIYNRLISNTTSV